MSNQNTQGQPSLPNPQEAFNHLYNTVHAPAFFNKLASFGYQPRTEKEAAELLELAGKLRMVEQDPQVKAASAANSPYAEANQALDRALSAYGLDGSIKQAGAQEREIGLRRVASQLAADPAVFNSVLSLKAAEAAQLAGQLGLDQDAAAQ